MPHNTIRLATAADVPAMAAIYAPYVQNTTASFEYTPPTEAELAARVAEIRGVLPWLVCERAGKITGYAYAHQFGVRKGYSWAAEPSVYVDETARRTGAGRALYAALEAVLKAQGYRGLYAVISHPNPASEAFHLKLGYKPMGLLQNIGYKFGGVLDVAYYGKQLLPPTQNPPPPLPLAQLGENALREILARHGG